MCKKWNKLWKCIQTSVEYKLQAVNEAVYDKFGKELDVLCHNTEKLFQIAPKNLIL
jgi:hypothetical protein